MHGIGLERDLLGEAQLVVATGEGALRLSGLTTQGGRAVSLSEVTAQGALVGAVLVEPDTAEREGTQAALAACAPHELFWAAALERFEPAAHPWVREGRSGVKAEVTLPLEAEVKAALRGASGLARVGTGLLASLAWLSDSGCYALGFREPTIYGNDTLDDIAGMLEDRARELGLEIDMRQSNHEGHLVDWLHEAHFEGAKAVILNAAGNYANVYWAVRQYLRPKYDALWKARLGDAYGGDPVARALAFIDRMLELT